MKILKQRDFNNIEWSDIIKLYMMFTEGRDKNRRHIKYNRYESDIIYTCQIYISLMDKQKKYNLLKESSIAIKLMDDPSTEFVQLHNMIWKI